MSTWTYRQSDGKAASKIVPPRLRIPCWKGLGADSEEKREPASDIDTVVVDSLKALDPKWPIREADITRVIHEEPAFAELFIAHLLARNSRVEEDLVDQLFNSSEKRLARILLLLA